MALNIELFSHVKKVGRIIGLSIDPWVFALCFIICAFSGPFLSGTIALEVIDSMFSSKSAFIYVR